NFTVVAALLSSVLILFSQYSGPPNRHSFPSRRSSDLSLLLIGPIWKFPIDRFIFKPKILIGRSSFVAETIGVLLKERNSNTYYQDRKSTRLNSSHVKISYAVCCLKKNRNGKHPDSCEG